MAAVSLVAVLALALLVFVAGSLAYWVRADADARGIDDPGRHAAWSVMVTPFLVYYLAVVRRGAERTRPVGRREHAAGTVAFAGIAGLLVGAAVAPPDPITQVRYWLAGTAALLPVGYYAVGRQDGG